MQWPRIFTKKSSGSYTYYIWCPSPMDLNIVFPKTNHRRLQTNRILIYKRKCKACKKIKLCKWNICIKKGKSSHNFIVCNNCIRNKVNLKSILFNVYRKERIEYFEKKI